MNNHNNKTNKRVQKSLKERFLLVLGIGFFVVYLTLGLMIIFWQKLSLNITPTARITFGILLIVYAFIRFLRLIKNNKE